MVVSTVDVFTALFHTSAFGIKLTADKVLTTRLIGVDGADRAFTYSRIKRLYTYKLHAMKGNKTMLKLNLIKLSCSLLLVRQECTILISTKPYNVKWYNETEIIKLCILH